jgi:xanthine dehydrogenase accessory factor
MLFCSFPRFTMSDTILDLAYRLTQSGEPFVLATVVWCERPTSAKPGAKAIIQANGQLTGWIGGSCAQPMVLREALRLLQEGGNPTPYLLRLGASDTGIARSDVRVFPMTCTSGGILDIYMEPHFPQPQLLLIGDSPVIASLSRLAEVLDFAVTHVDNTDLSQVHIDERTYVLVATHGQYDEDVLEQVLRSPARYVGMVGSRKRAEACRAYLRTSGLTDQQIARLKAPAGLDLGTVTPEEIAASILAELVQVRRRGTKPRMVGAGDPVWGTGNAPALALEVQPTLQPSIAENAVPAVSATETAIDPVCGMIVEIAMARHQSTYDDRAFYFCCPACKRQFERDPQAYLVQHER